MALRKVFKWEFYVLLSILYLRSINFSERVVYETELERNVNRRVNEKQLSYVFVLSYMCHSLRKTNTLKMYVFHCVCLRNWLSTCRQTSNLLCNARVIIICSLEKEKLWIFVCGHEQTLNHAAREIKTLVFYMFISKFRKRENVFLIFEKTNLF